MLRLMPPELGPLLIKGQPVRGRRKGPPDEWSYGHVGIVSGNGVSVGIHLVDAVRTSDGGLVANFLPVLIDDAAETITGLDGTEYELELKWPPI